MRFGRHHLAIRVGRSRPLRPPPAESATRSSIDRGPFFAVTPSNVSSSGQFLALPRIVTVSLEVNYANAGAARAAGTQRVLDHFAARQVDDDMLWLAHTDADTHVPPDWLTRQLHYAALGYDAVAGVVDVDSFDEYPLDVIDAFAERYGTGLTDHHTHVHGANLGVRASAYRRIGGWPAMALSEDHGLWNLLNAYGHPTIAERTVRVTTSGRAVSRCPGGFADVLRKLAGFVPLSELAI